MRPRRRNVIRSTTRNQWSSRSWMMCYEYTYYNASFCWGDYIRSLFGGITPDCSTPLRTATGNRGYAAIVIGDVPQPFKTAGTGNTRKSEKSYWTAFICGYLAWTRRNGSNNALRCYCLQLILSLHLHLFYVHHRQAKGTWWGSKLKMPFAHSAGELVPFFQNGSTALKTPVGLINISFRHLLIAYWLRLRYYKWHLVLRRRV